MAAFSPLPPLSLFIPGRPFSCLNPIHLIISTIHHRSTPSPPPLHVYASRRISNYTQEGGLVSGPPQWGRSAFYEDGGDEDTDDEGDDDDRSLDLLVRFIQNVFRKISRRARKAVRSVLPISISTRLADERLPLEFAEKVILLTMDGVAQNGSLAATRAIFDVFRVRFSVNGVIILAFLWVLKAFLEVVCTLGSIVFVSILLIRVIWSGVSYFQESRFISNSGANGDSSAWTGAQPVS